MRPISFTTKWFCFTGRLDNFTREQAYQLVRDRGGHVENRISPRTSYLIVGAKAGSKLDKAMSKGVNIRNEAEFAMAVLVNTSGFTPRKHIVIPEPPKIKKEVIAQTERVFAFDE